MTADTPCRSAENAKNVQARTAGGAFVLIAVNLLNRCIGVISFSVLARLLSPSDFGVVSLAMIVIEFTQVLTDFQIVNVLIHSSRDDDHLYRTAFTFSMLRGVVAAAAILIAAEPAALLMGNMAIRDILFALAAVPLIDGLRSPRIVEFARRLDFSRDALVVGLSRVVAVTVMVILALSTRSYWSLVAGTLAASVTGTVLTHIFRPFPPRFGLREYQVFLSFGGWITGAGVTNYTSFKLDSLIVASQFSIARFGQYNFGVQLATMATSYLAEPIQRAVFPALSGIADLSRRTRAYLRAQAAILGVLMPIGFGMALVAHEMVIVMAGPKWLEAVTVLQFVAPTLAIGTISAGAQAMMMAQGDTRAIFLRNLAVLVLRVPLLWFSLQAGGIIGLLTAWALSGFFFAYLTLRMVATRINVPVFAPFRLAWRSFAAIAAMILCVLLVDRLIPSAGTNFLGNLAHLLFKAAVGGITYFGIHLLLWIVSGRPDSFERFALNHVRRLTASLRRGVAVLHR